ncbi:methylated-DNA--[protein]-cysteine S-methyltransferase [uncultured Roseovarius sp.]|uniref:methylated-DNA--[protein]-cysteine S-methyltransferase n=1 Tax=uncultured Roseovarius sp. TaxID=293344 RepID=UPI002626B927|nr:methylated-DNA--[protein]-cysteine S-methyltransferase [uncultured Roseovarius sp.]
MPSASLDTPIGPLTVDARDGKIFRVRWVDDPDGPETPQLTAAILQLRAYFEGARDSFDLPLHVDGSDFQRAVCDAMYAIPLGETRTYGDLAAELNVPAQAIGGACGGNPIPVIIPCHRVLGATTLGGFSGMGGVETKVWLLRHEKAGGLLI